MAHLLTDGTSLSRALVLQDRQITNVRKDANTGIDLEQERPQDEGKNYFQDIPFSPEIEDEIRRIGVVRAQMLPPPALIQPDMAPHGLLRIFELVEIRALQRLPPDSLYPYDSHLLSAGPPETIFAVCGKNHKGEMERPEVISFKLILLAAGAVQRGDCLPDGAPVHMCDLEELREHLELGTEDEVLPYLASLGVCLVLLAVAKPFVSKVTAATRTMCTNMIGDLKLKPEHLSQEIFAAMFKNFLSKIDLRALARFTMNRKFRGWQWGTAYAARFGAGTSHLTAISTFIARFPDFPLWHLVPQQEIDSFLGAIDEVARDPLFLFPVVGEPEMEKDRFRVSAMPVLLCTAVFGLGAVGDKNWLRYENVPFLTSVGSLTPQSYLNALRQWCKIKMQPESPDMLMEKYQTFSMVQGYKEDLPLSGFVQPAVPDPKITSLRIKAKKGMSSSMGGLAAIFTPKSTELRHLANLPGGHEEDDHTEDNTKESVIGGDEDDNDEVFKNMLLALDARIEHQETLINTYTEVQAQILEKLVKVESDVEELSNQVVNREMLDTALKPVVKNLDDIKGIVTAMKAAPIMSSAPKRTPSPTGKGKAVETSRGDKPNTGAPSIKKSNLTIAEIAAKIHKRTDEVRGVVKDSGPGPSYS